MKNIRNMLVLSVLIAGAAWTNVAKPDAMTNKFVTQLINKLQARSAVLQQALDAWW